ncbi:arylesterase [Tunturiibacter gelidiferens]|uniref:arylesterase n=1 Tax=Tunturiibacter gelidiferens TaxID=3069689 RepID=UPI003D9B77C8
MSVAILAVLPLLVVALSLSGCRADKTTKPSEVLDSSQPVAESAAPDAASEPSPAAANDKRPVIVCFGDSLTAGYGTDLGQSYPDYLQTDLNAEGYNYRVVNEGISGNTTKDGVDRLDRVLALKPAVVVVEFGGNDGLRGLRIEDSRTNLDRIVGTLKASGTKVVLAGITLPPDYGPDYIKQFDDTYATLAAKYHVPILPFLLKGVFGVDGMMQADRTHATSAGNQIVAKNVLPLVTPLLKNRATRERRWAASACRRCGGRLRVSRSGW